MRLRLALALAAATVPLAFVPAAAFAQEAPAASEGERLNAWFETKFEEQLQFSPLTLTALGRRDRYGDLDDFSVEGADWQLAWYKASVEELEREFVGAFRGVVPNDRRFLGGETIGELFDRVLPALERLLADDGWDTVLAVLHGAVNRSILSYALTGERMFLGHFEQAPACANVLDLGEGGEWIVRAVNVAPYDLLHLSHRQTTMERYWQQWLETQ